MRRTSGLGLPEGSSRLAPALGHGALWSRAMAEPLTDSRALGSPAVWRKTQPGAVRVCGGKRGVGDRGGHSEGGFPTKRAAVLRFLCAADSMIG